jgi:hypothetical protein
MVPFTGLSPQRFGRVVTALRKVGADPVRKGRPWSLPLEDRALLVISTTCPAPRAPQLQARDRSPSDEPFVPLLDMAFQVGVDTPQEAADSFV